VLLARVLVLAQVQVLERVLTQQLVLALVQEPALVLVLTLLADNYCKIVMSAACRHNSETFFGKQSLEKAVPETGQLFFYIAE
jgi:hypothetical protein